MPVYSQSDRMGIVAGLKCVDSVFLEESLEKKADYIRQFNADTLVMGDDWAGRFDSLSYLCEVPCRLRKNAAYADECRQYVADVLYQDQGKLLLISYI